MTASPPRRYTAEELKLMAKECPTFVIVSEKGNDVLNMRAMLEQASEDSARLEQIEQILQMDMRLNEQPDQEYRQGWNAATDTLKVMLASAGRREETEGR